MIFSKNRSLPTRKPPIRNSQIYKLSILEAADGSTNTRIHIVPVHFAIVGVQDSAPGEAAEKLISTPEVSIISNTIEITSR